MGLAFQLTCAMVMVLMSVFATNALDQLRKAVVSTGLKGWCCRPLVLLVADLPDSSVAVLLGAAAGMALKLLWGVKVVFSDQLFFYVMLPPIIFYQGYSLKKKSFFRYIHYIVALGLVGTLAQFFLLTLFISLLHRLTVLVPLPGPTMSLTPQEVLLLAALLTSCDEVATLSLIKRERYPKLWSILFGEGVLNDAVSILLFRSVLKGPRSLGLDTYPLTITLSAIYLLVLSTLIGVSIGLLLSRILKVAVSLREHPTRQCVVFILGAYLSFVSCEMLEVPGVLGVFFCGEWALPLYNLYYVIYRSYIHKPIDPPPPESCDGGALQAWSCRTSGGILWPTRPRWGRRCCRTRCPHWPRRTPSRHSACRSTASARPTTAFASP